MVIVLSLLLVATALVSVALVLVAAQLAIRRQWRSMRRTLYVFFGLLAAYASALLGFAVTSSERRLSLGQDRCFDDWCMAVTAASELAASNQREVLVTLKISSRALRVTQKADSPVVELVDGQSHHYGPSVPADLSRTIGPGDSYVTEAVFDVPATATGLAVSLAEGGWPTVLILGDDNSPFHKPTVVPLGD